ncbi:Bcr/CflA family drug resistance efflux transporter, partial [Escherichia coli]|nr:Bcr/CflA family drug resistance efflux transporter [Escherichia coli]
YGFMGCAVAMATILGAWLSNWRLMQNSPHKIIKEGILLALIGTLFLSMVALFPLNIQVIFYIFFISIIL